QAASSLGFIGPDARAAVPRLIELLDDEGVSVRGPAVLSLGRIGPASRSAVPKMALLLRDRNDLVRYQALLALGWMGPDAKDAFAAIVEYRNAIDRKRDYFNGYDDALKALQKIDPAAAAKIGKP